MPEWVDGEDPIAEGEPCLDENDVLLGRCDCSARLFCDVESPHGHSAMDRA